jgi:hypothetical protein
MTQVPSSANPFSASPQQAPQEAATQGQFNYAPVQFPQAGPPQAGPPQAAAQPLPAMPPVPGQAPGTNPFGGAGDDEFAVDMDNMISNSIAVGPQTIQLMNVTKDVSQRGNDMFVWEFAVAEGKDSGKTAKLWTALSANALWKLEEVLNALGRPSRGKVAFRKPDVVGVLCVGVFAEDEFQGRKTSKLERLEPHPNGAGFRRQGMPVAAS